MTRLLVRADDLEIHQQDWVVPLEVTSTPIRDDSGKIIYAIATHCQNQLCE